MRRTNLVIAVLFIATLWNGSALAEMVGNEAVVGEGSMTDSANVGSGEQINANDWEDMLNVNAGGNQLTGGGMNSNGGDRTSNDVVIILPDYPVLASTALDVTVSGNEIGAGGDGASVDSTVAFSDSSGFRSSYGVTAVAINAGANASQSISINVMSEVSL